MSNDKDKFFPPPGAPDPKKTKDKAFTPPVEYPDAPACWQPGAEVPLVHPDILRVDPKSYKTPPGVKMRGRWVTKDDAAYGHSYNVHHMRPAQRDPAGPMPFARPNIDPNKAEGTTIENGHAIFMVVPEHVAKKFDEQQRLENHERALAIQPAFEDEIRALEGAPLLSLLDPQRPSSRPLRQMAAEPSDDDQ